MMCENLKLKNTDNCSTEQLLKHSD